MDRRLFYFIVSTIAFSIGVIVWFFFFSKPSPSPSLSQTNNPFPTNETAPRSQFITNKEGDDLEKNSITEVTEYTPQPLTNIWNNPATGATFVSVDTLREVISTSTEGTTTITESHFVHATGTILMFVDRASGHIYGYDRDRHKTYQISNTTIPGVYDAYIFNNGKNVVFRYPDNEKNIIVGVLATIPQVNEESQPESLQKITYLPAQVTSVATNKSGTELSYLVSNDAGSSVYTISQGKKEVLIASSPLKAWTLAYGGNTLYATSKPTAYMLGETVMLPSFEFVVGDMPGLISNPGENGYILNSVWVKGGSKVFFTKNGVVGNLPVQTLASKCGWGDGIVYCGVPKKIPYKSEGLPDDWFQGSVSFDDTLLYLDPAQKIGDTVSTLETPASLPFDITNIVVSTENRFIAFIRKQDGSLWLIETSLLDD